MNLKERRDKTEIRSFYDLDGEPFVLHIIKSGFTEEPNLIVLEEGPYDDAIKYIGLFTTNEIQEKYKIKLSITS